MKVRLSIEQKKQVQDTEDIYTIMRAILMRENKHARKQEHVWVIGLDNAAVIQLIELVALGTLNKAVITPADVFSLLLQKKCSYFVLVHNHPSGILKPSEADLDLTDHMQQIGAFQKLPLRDHLIISEEGYYSMADKGDLQKLWVHTKYPLHMIEKIYEANKAKEEGAKEKAIEMAKIMKLGGADVKLIAIASGLSNEEIEKL